MTHFSRWKNNLIKFSNILRDSLQLYNTFSLSMKYLLSHTPNETLNHYIKRFHFLEVRVSHILYVNQLNCMKRFHSFEIIAKSHIIRDSLYIRYMK